MNRLMLVAGVVALSGVAYANGNDGTTPLDPLDPIRVVSPLTIVQGDGIKVGEGTSIYPQVGLETGFVSNVFYESSNPIAAGILRLILEAGAGSLSPQRRRAPMDVEAAEGANEGSFAYTADLYATWDQYLSSNGKVTDQGGLGFGAYLRGIVNPGRPISFQVTESFDRALRPANFESTTNANRDLNWLSLQLGINPSGRSIGGSLTYANNIDRFEDSTNQFADRMHHLISARVNYKFLPLSLAYLDVSQGIFTGLGSASTKTNSYPLTATLGVNTALTVKTSVLARVGYTQGFYSSGPSFQTVVGGVYLDHRYSPMGVIRAMYSYDHQDSLNANFYRDHVLQAWFEQQVNPFAIYVSPVLRLRRYEGLNPPLMGPLVRDDVIFATSVGMRYQFRNWITATAEYRLVLDDTNYRYTGGAAMTDPSYVRHEVFAGVRVAY